MRRRDFIVVLGGSAVARGRAVAAQQSNKVPVIGFLGSASAASFAPQIEAFRKGLAEAGYVEGRTVAIDYRWAEDRYERLPGFAAELAARNVDVIHASGPPAALAAKAATATVPITFVVGFDPVAAGLVSSLSRPGGNLTGMYLYIGGLVAKKLELLREFAPRLHTFGLLVNPGTPSAKLDAEEMKVGAGEPGRETRLILNAGTEAEIDSIFADLAGRKTAGAVIGTDTVYFGHRAHIVAVAARLRVPTIYYAREFVTAGGLMSYGANIPDTYRQAGVYTARVLRGEKPADMPVQQPSTIEFVINAGAAKGLDIGIPPSLLARADEVIE